MLLEKERFLLLICYYFFIINGGLKNMSSTSKASQRINALLDDNSFVEIGALVTARATDFDLKQTENRSCQQKRRGKYG